MAFHVRDPETDAAVRRLAALRGKGIAETIREAVEAATRAAEPYDRFGKGATSRAP